MSNNNSSSLLVLARIQRDWINCRRCPLGTEAFRHVLYEAPPLIGADMRLDVLFIGEAPGRSEDVIGRPFIGRSGRFLREVIESTNLHGLRVGYSNLLACRPVDSQGKDRPPEGSEVAACHGRLVSVLQVFNPWAVVGLGRVPQTFLPPILADSGWRGEEGWFPHPSYLIRTGGKNSAHYPEYRARFEEIFETVKRLQRNSEAEAILSQRKEGSCLS